MFNSCWFLPDIGFHIFNNFVEMNNEAPKWLEVMSIWWATQLVLEARWGFFSSENNDRPSDSWTLRPARKSRRKDTSWNHREACQIHQRDAQHGEGIMQYELRESLQVIIIHALWLFPLSLHRFNRGRQTTTVSQNGFENRGKYYTIFKDDYADRLNALNNAVHMKSSVMRFSKKNTGCSRHKWEKVFPVKGSSVFCCACTWCAKRGMPDQCVFFLGDFHCFVSAKVVHVSDETCSLFLKKKTKQPGASNPLNNKTIQKHMMCEKNKENGSSLSLHCL